MRPSDDEVLMEMAQAVALRGTCCRRQVGAILVTATDAIFRGYNGAPRGLPHCTEVGCEVVDGHCVACVHAEVNAIVKAARSGGMVDGATLVTTASPCRRCMMAAINAGVKRVVYADDYGDQWSHDTARKLDIEMVRVQPRNGP